MLITRVLFLSGLTSLAACATPTGPNESRTSIEQPTPQPPGGHFSGTMCGAKKMDSQLCAQTSGRN
jgi:hypothetical protein